MTDLLLSTARRMGIETEVSAGPGGKGLGGAQIWARWPRHRLEIAQDLLNHITTLDQEAKITPLGATPLWRARCRDWTYIGRFEDAVAHLAIHVEKKRELALPHPAQDSSSRYAAR